MKRILALLVMWGLLVMVWCPWPAQAADVPRWLLADLHVHTTNSDGVLAPQDAVAKYENAGYDVLAITDHDVFTRVTSSKLLIIPALEWTYAESPPYHKHLLMYFVSSKPASVADAYNQGALISVAHPLTWSPYLKPKDLPAQVTAYEYYNANLASTGFSGYAPAWCSYLKVKTAGSDAHTVKQYTSVKLLIYAQKNAVSIKQALQAGQIKLQ